MQILSSSSRVCHPHTSQDRLELFNRRDRFPHGWYWALRSKDLRKNRASNVSLLGKELVIYRRANGSPVALDAYCPHMGAHLGEGTVEGDEIRCLFHRWKFGSDGSCTEIPGDIPSESRCSQVKQLRSWPVADWCGLIWVWVGDSVPSELPTVPELRGRKFSFLLGKQFSKDCHPNVVMINAIDEQHFVSVHRMNVDLNMEAHEVSTACIIFANTKPIPRNSFFSRLVKQFYRGAGTYELSYYFGSSGTVTLGPDFLHFHLMFALRPTVDGRAEGQTISLAPTRDGIIGWCLTMIILWVTRFTSDYFAHGDTKIFRSIRFNLATPVKADKSIVRFIQHVERQPIAEWGFSQPNG